jgi:hypothetical protein
MASKGFGSDLWKNVRAVRIDKDGTFRVPVRANGRDGIAIGVDAVEQAGVSPESPAAPAGLWRRLRDRLRRR